jgi:hypothetical protein
VVISAPISRQRSVYGILRLWPDATSAGPGFPRHSVGQDHRVPCRPCAGRAPASFGYGTGASRLPAPLSQELSHSTSRVSYSGSLPVFHPPAVKSWTAKILARIHAISEISPHALKIPWGSAPVWVRFPPPAPAFAQPRLAPPSVELRLASQLTGEGCSAEATRGVIRAGALRRWTSRSTSARTSLG